MSEAAVKYIVDNFNLDEHTAQHIINAYLDQVRTVGQTPTEAERRAAILRLRELATGGGVREFREIQAGGVRPEPTPGGRQEEQRPPARKVALTWLFKTVYDPIEPYVTWVPGLYFMGKAGAASFAGLSMSAVKPVKLGGMSAREILAAKLSPALSEKFNEWLTLPRSQRFSFNRPKAPKTSELLAQAGRNLGLAQGGAIPPRVLGVGAWMPAAGIVAGVAPPPEPGRAIPRTVSPTEGECPPGFTLTTTGRCVPAQALE